MRFALIAVLSWLGAMPPAMAQVSIGISIPGVSIGINQPAYPELVPVPGYPVYYAPHAQANYFFYDGLYWVYQDDRWYSSAWYDGPWDYVEPHDVPLFVLRVPVRYYVHPPVYFRGWAVTAPPRWDLHWGPHWAQHRHGWEHWDRRLAYAPAPLPVYQRHYHGERYPRAEYQQVIRREHYHYQPRDHAVREREHARMPSRPHPAQHNADFQREQRPSREREEPRRPGPMQVLPQQHVPAMQEQRPQPRHEAERRAPPQPREMREREAARQPEGMQVLPQQRAVILQERQQQQQQRQAPRPQQAQDRGERQHRDHGERRQGPERGGDRGPGRG